MKLQELLQDPAYKQKFVLEKLIQEYLGFSREAMWIGLEQEIPADKLETIQNAYKSCVEDKKPLEYVVGHVNFFGVPFYVNENTIIPRPETEYMISAVSEYIASFRTVPRPVVLRDGEEGSDLSLAAGKQGDFQNHILLDIGTGSGVLGISILFHNPNFYRSIFLCDISPEALIVAKKNYDTLIRSTYYDTRFVQSDLAAFVESYPDIMQSGPITLVANLPYIPDETFDNNALENVQKREPRLAFVGGEDGLDLYRQMFEQLRTLCLESFSLNLTMFLEMMTRQVDILKAEFGDWLEFEEVKTFHFNIRIVKAWIK